MKLLEIKSIIAIIIIICSFSYFFGSSSQSAKKDETISNLTEKTNERN